MNTSKLKLPKTKTKKVYIGVYGGHYNNMIIFAKKPKFTNEICVDLLEESENNNIICDCSPHSFLEWFEVSKQVRKFILNPKACDIFEVIQTEITAPFDKYGKILGLNTNSDGYNR